MVNTFVPWPDEHMSAKALDIKRLGKQRVEGLQILKANLGLTKGWVNHPAAVMWRGHEGALYNYTNIMCIEWRTLGYKDTIQQQLQDINAEHELNSWEHPWWWGKDIIHLSHQSNLKRKDPLHYSFDVPDDLPYQWPMPNGTFRVTKKKEAGNGLRKRRANSGQP